MRTQGDEYTAHGQTRYDGEATEADKRVEHTAQHPRFDVAMPHVGIALATI
jgi:hypothetical protein